MPDNPGILDRLFSLEGKTALITGASGGIGRALSVAFSQAGARVVLTGTNRDKLEELRGHIEQIGGQAAVLPIDLGDAKAARGLVPSALSELGRLDILVNNAGMNRRMPMVEYGEDDYDRIMDVNLKSIFILCQEAQPIMKAQGGGKIVNVGSLTSLIGVGNVAVYGMTKAAVAQLTKTLAVEWAKDNIQVNCLAPGFIKTPLTAQGQWADPHISQWILQRVPARRPGTPQDLVGTALWLCSPASDFVTGQIVAVDGAFLAGASWTKDDG